MNAGFKQAACLLLICSAPAATAAEPENLVAVAPAAYEDRLIDGGNLSADVSSGNETQDTSGWPRSLRLEAITSKISRSNADQNESGLRMNAMLDTPNFGALTLDANLRTSSGQHFGSDTGNTFTLYQLGLPMDGGWRVNNSLGVTSAPSVDLAHQQQRFWVPSILQNGLSTEWRSPGGLQLQASAGQPGLLTGIYVPTFEGLGGEQISAGAQWTGRNGWSAALQAVNVDDVRFGLGPLTSSRTISGHTEFGSVAWGTPDARVQFNVASSTSDEQSGQVGAWIDTALRAGRLQHTFGAFRFDPEMFWGNQPLISNQQGGYYRAAFQSRQWVVDGGLDYTKPVSGSSQDTVFATGYTRYQMSSRLGVGGGVNVRESNTTAWSTFGFVDLSNRLGIGRVQADYASDDRQERAQLTLNQTWNTPAGTRLGNSFALGTETFAGRSTNIVGIAVNGGGDLRSNLTADLNARWDNSSGRAQTNNVMVNASLNWMIASGWALGANYYINRYSGRTPLDVTSPIDDLPLFASQRANDQGFFITLRRQWQAGSRSAPLGGAPGSGSGNIDGFLYLDENDNGIMDAGERGVPNVVILVDGRFAARTNADGRFEFSTVAAGTHSLTVVPDNLPLPWAVQNEGKSSVTVNVRQHSFVAIGARRQR